MSIVDKRTMEIKRMKKNLNLVRKLTAILVIWSIINTIIGIGALAVTTINTVKLAKQPVVLIGDFDGPEFED